MPREYRKVTQDIDTCRVCGNKDSWEFHEVVTELDISSDSGYPSDYQGVWVHKGEIDRIESRTTTQQICSVCRITYTPVQGWELLT